jgi:hypothetical protein
MLDMYNSINKQFSSVVSNFTMVSHAIMPDDADGEFNGLVGLEVKSCWESKVQCHDPPPPVAHLLRVRSCLDSCVICQTKGCVVCPYCAVGYDGTGESLTLLFMAQTPRTPVKYQSFFVIEGQAYRIAGGLAVMFHGLSSPHGTWSPSIPVPLEFRCSSVAFTRKKWNWQ